MSGALTTHLSATYYRPSWQGGDISVPRCRRGTEGFYVDAGESIDLSDALVFVTCRACWRLIEAEAAA